MEKFIEFNLEIALQKPHLVRSKRFTDLICQKATLEGDNILIDWTDRANQFSYNVDTASHLLQLLVEEPVQAAKVEHLNVIEYEGKMYNKVPFIEDYYAPDILCFSSTDNVKVKTIAEGMGGMVDVVFYDKEELYVPKEELKDHIYVLLPITPEQVAKVKTEQFTEFNLRLAIEKPYLVRHKIYEHYRCNTVAIDGDGSATILISWDTNEMKKLHYYYTKAAIDRNLHMLAEEPEQTAKVNTEQAVSLEPEQLESVLQEAERLIGGQRAADYGSAFDSFTNISKMWSVIIGIEVTAVQVAHAMIALKLCRSTNSKGVKRDDWVDICGYAQLGYNIANQIKDNKDGN